MCSAERLALDLETNFRQFTLFFQLFFNMIVHPSSFSEMFYLLRFLKPRKEIHAQGQQFKHQKKL